MRYFIFTCSVCLAIIMTGSSCKEKISRKVVNNEIIEAHYINDSIIDGVANYYNSSDELIYVCTYKNGLKNGPAVHYFENGLKADSSFYDNDLINGYTYSYDSAGNLLCKQNHYYGLKVGDRTYYEFGKLNAYQFSDFDQNFLIDCEYDSKERCRLQKFKMYASLTLRLNGERQSALGVFIYFPKPPKLTVTQTLGLQNVKKETKNEYVIPDNRLFLDTTLNYPDSGWHYFISTHIKDKTDSIDKVLIQILETN